MGETVLVDAVGSIVRTNAGVTWRRLPSLLLVESVLRCSALSGDWQVCHHDNVPSNSWRATFHLLQPWVHQRTRQEPSCSTKRIICLLSSAASDFRGLLTVLRRRAHVAEPLARMQQHPLLPGLLPAAPQHPAAAIQWGTWHCVAAQGAPCADMAPEQAALGAGLSD